MKFDIWEFFEIFVENSSLFKVWQEWRVIYLKTCVYLWWYVAGSFLEKEMFQTEVQKIESHFMFNNFSESHAYYYYYYYYYYY
jgi:hypothetical protein